MEIMTLWTLITAGASLLILTKMLALLRRSGVRFNFRLTDLYAAVLCLSPAMAWLGYSIDHLDERDSGADRYFYIWLCGTALLNMVLGLAIGRIDIQLPPHDKAEPTAVESASSILVGSVYGFLLTVIFALFLLYYATRMAARIVDVNAALTGKEPNILFRRLGK